MRATSQPKERRLTPSTPVGRIVNWFSRDLQKADALLPSKVSQFFTQVGVLVCLTVVICIACWPALPFLAIVGAAILLFHATFIKSTVELQRLEGITRAPVFVHYEQTLLGLPTIRAGGGQSAFLRTMLSRLKNHTLSSYVLSVGQMWYSQRLEWMGRLVSTATVLVVVVLRNWFAVDTG